MTFIGLFLVSLMLIYITSELLGIIGKKQCIASICLFKFPACVNYLLQKGQSNGRSPMCFLKWSLILQDLLKILPQFSYRHWKYYLDRNSNGFNTSIILCISSGTFSKCFTSPNLTSSLTPYNNLVATPGY